MFCAVAIWCIADSGADLVLAANILDSENHVFLLDTPHVKPTCRDFRHHITDLELMQNRHVSVALSRAKILCISRFANTASMFCDSCP